MKPSMIFLSFSNPISNWAFDSIAITIWAISSDILKHYGPLLTARASTNPVCSMILDIVKTYYGKITVYISSYINYLWHDFNVLADLKYEKPHWINSPHEAFLHKKIYLC